MPQRASHGQTHKENATELAIGKNIRKMPQRASHGQTHKENATELA